MNMNLDGHNRVNRRFPLRERSTAKPAVTPGRRPRWVMTFAALFPLTLPGLFASPSAGIAQGPGEAFPCRACSPQLCRADDHVYDACTWTETGTKKCTTQEQGNGCPIGDTCRDFGGFCEKPKLALSPSQDEAIQVFQNGGLLPAEGGFYVATRGDRLLLRSKCGNQEIVAEIARRDVRRRRAAMVLAGG